ncbi:hypothetical protein AB0L82_42315 [Nocardia sp. NPDC052001]|uniref:hypothetical protein n=1 Tax=Nocardia sp. NPDC052001 TaxID=3154853 RepID=UPI00341783AA
MLPRIPMWGWPGGLARRRNGALLVLVAHDLPCADVARLMLGDILVEDNVMGSGTTVARHRGGSVRLLLHHRSSSLIRPTDYPKVNGSNQIALWVRPLSLCGEVVR